MEYTLRNVALLAASMLLFGFDSSKVELASVHYQDGPQLVVEVDASSLSEASAWSPTSGWPSIGLDRVIASAKTRLHEANPKFDDFQVNRVEMQRRYYSGSKTIWFFVVHFDPIIDGNSLMGPGYWAVVLIDGSVHLPEKR